MSEDPKPRSLDHLRVEIDRVDRALLDLLAERCSLSGEVIRAKGKGALRDPTRERALLEKLVGIAAPLGLDAHFVTTVFHELIAQSLRLQQGYLQGQSAPAGSEGGRLAYLGPEGSWSQEAAQRWSAHQAGGGEVALQTRSSLGSVYRAVEKGEAELGLLPVENTSTGAIAESFDLLAAGPLSIVGEQTLSVAHALAVSPGATLEGLKTVHSHPQALAQCRNRLDSLGLGQLVPETSTAQAAAELARTPDPTRAVLCRAAIAGELGLEILFENVCDHPENATRFLVVAAEGRLVDERVPAKTSLVLGTAQRSGALVEVLLVFRAHRLILTRLESRPIPGNPWEELFHLDFLGNIARPEIAAALKELESVTRFLRILGSYPADALPPVELEAPAPASPPPTRPQARANLKVGRVEFGGAHRQLLPGPATVENATDVAELARTTRAAGLPLLHVAPRSLGARGGADPEALRQQFREDQGLALILPVGRGHDLAVRAACASMLALAPAAMEDAELLEAVGALPLPVILRRAPHASLEEWIAAARTILARGNRQLLLSEAGIQLPGGRRLAELDALPALRDALGLPIVVELDAGLDAPARLAAARAALAAGADAIWAELADDAHDEVEALRSLLAQP